MSVWMSIAVRERGDSCVQARTGFHPRLKQEKEVFRSELAWTG